MYFLISWIITKKSTILSLSESCKLVKNLSQLSVSAGLAQQIQPMSSVQPITAGQRITLDCTVTNANMDEKIEWYHDGDVISFGQSLLRDREGAYTLQVTQEQGVPSTYHWIITIANANIIRDEGSWSCNFAPEGSVAQVVVTDLLVIGRFQTKLLIISPLKLLGMIIVVACLL